MPEGDTYIESNQQCLSLQFIGEPASLGRPLFAALSTYNTALTAIDAKATVQATRATRGTPDYEKGFALPSPLNASDAATGRGMMLMRRRSRKGFAFVITDADNETITGRVWLWLPFRLSESDLRMVPFAAGDITATAGQRTCPWITDGRFADEIALTNVTAPSGASLEAFSRSAQDIAVLEVSTRGMLVMELELTRNGGTSAGFQVYEWDR